MVEALDAGDVTKLGIGIIVVLVLLGLVIGAFITALIARVVIALLVVVLAIAVWQQRSSIEHKIDRKACNLTFFGVHLDPPDSFKARCSKT